MDPRLLQAQRELEMHFAAAAGLWGLRATPLDGSGAARPWDDQRSHREHGRRVGFALCGPGEGLRAIARTVRELEVERPWAYAVALAVLTPRRWPTRLATEMARGALSGNLTGLLVRSARLSRRCRRGATAGELLAFAAARAEQTDAAQRRAFFDPLRDDAERLYARALRAYEPLRRARLKADRLAEERTIASDRWAFRAA